MNVKVTGPLFAISLGALTALAPISIDMALPALHDMHSDSSARMGLTGLALSVYVLGLAVSSFFYGPVIARLRGKR
jgi:DHA1 family bicyclomycin/chloramphenicol resistance-like MFS transporter